MMVVLHSGALVLPRSRCRRVRHRARGPSTAACCAQVGHGGPTRRQVVGGAALLAAWHTFLAPSRSLAADSGDWSSPGLAKPGPDATYIRTPGGVVYELISGGTGDAAASGDVVQFQYTLRRANGYFIYATIECGVGCGDGTPETATLGKTPLIAGLEELLTGMRPGEKRRALIPPALGYTRDGLLPQPPEFGQRRQVIVHAREPLVFEARDDACVLCQRRNTDVDDGPHDAQVRLVKVKRA